MRPSINNEELSIVRKESKIRFTQKLRLEMRQSKNGHVSIASKFNKMILSTIYKNKLSKPKKKLSRSINLQSHI